MDRHDRSFRPKFAPVKVGDELDVKIEAVGEKGDGIAKKDGFVLFVPNTQKDQEVKIRVTRVLRNVGFAEVVGEGSSPAEDPQTDQTQGQEEQPEEETASEEPEQPVEDTEDFGEEEKKE